MKNWPLIVVMLFVSACVEQLVNTADNISNTRGVRWSPTIAIPLVYSHLTIDELIKTGGDLVDHRIDQEGVISLLYRSNLFSLTAEEVFQLPDQGLSENIVLSSAQLSALSGAGSVSFQLVKEYDFSYGLNRVDSIIYKQGSFDVELSSTLQHDISASVKVLGSEQNGQELQHNLAANYGGSLPNTGNSSLDLNGATVDFTTGTQGFSQLKLQIDITVTQISGNPIGSSESIDIDLSLSNQLFRYIVGLLENADITNGSDSLKAKIFSNSQGSFTVADPMLRLYFYNSFGIPAQLVLSQFDGTSEGGNTVSLTGFPNPYLLGRASYRGHMYEDSILLNTGNSNLAAYINNMPKYNEYLYNMVTFGTTTHWALDTSVVRCDVEMELPLHGTAKDYELVNHAAFDGATELADVDDYIEKIMFRLHTENGFPIDVSYQFYFEDSINNQIIDSLFVDPLVLPAASVDGNGRTETVYPKTTDVWFEHDRLLQLKTANRIRMVGRFNTYTDNGSQPNVKLFEDYEMLIQFGIQVKLSIEESL